MSSISIRMNWRKCQRGHIKVVSVNLGCSFSFFRDLFNQDRNKDEFEAAHLIVKEWGGVESIAKGLETDLAVSNPLTLSFLSLNSLLFL